MVDEVTVIYPAELEELVGENTGSVAAPVRSRTVKLTPASTITPRPVRWVWRNRVAVGTLALLAGREGIGKSMLAYTVAAWLTRGVLPGIYHEQPRAVIVAATEDSWEHTIVPRLMAAGADLDLVYRVDVSTASGFEAVLTLPVDLHALEQVVVESQAALILLDPLISRLSAELDTYKDAEVRQALEPLVALANRSECCVLGIIHLNKSARGDAGNRIMGSKAFNAVPRSVLFVTTHPRDEDIKLLGQTKNNLGRLDLPTHAYRIVGELVTTTNEGEVWTGKIEWLDNSEMTIAQVLEASSEDPEERSATREAEDWLRDYLVSVGGRASSAEAKRQGKRAGHSERTLRRASKAIGVVVESSGFPRQTFWSLPPD